MPILGCRSPNLSLRKSRKRSPQRRLMSDIWDLIALRFPWCQVPAATPISGVESALQPEAEVTLGANATPLQPEPSAPVISSQSSQPTETTPFPSTVGPVSSQPVSVGQALGSQHEPSLGTLTLEPHGPQIQNTAGPVSTEPLSLGQAFGSQQERSLPPLAPLAPLTLEPRGVQLQKILRQMILQSVISETSYVWFILVYCVRSLTFKYIN